MIPSEKDTAKQIVLNRERVEFWLGQGAVPSDTLAETAASPGDQDHVRPQRRPPDGQGPSDRPQAGASFFTATERIVAEKKAKEAEEKAKAEAEAKAAKAKADAEAKAAEGAA
jgi:hypothetical protein